MSTDSGSCGSLDRAQARMAMFEFQEPARLNQAAPVQNTYYEILPETENCRVYQIAINVEDTDETLDVLVTKDGVACTPSPLACTHSTAYGVYMRGEPVNRNWLSVPAIIASFGPNRGAFLLEGHSVKVEVRKTTANGVGNLTGIVIHGVLNRV